MFRESGHDWREQCRRVPAIFFRALPFVMKKEAGRAGSAIW